MIDISNKKDSRMKHNQESVIDRLPEENNSKTDSLKESLSVAYVELNKPNDISQSKKDICHSCGSNLPK